MPRTSRTSPSRLRAKQKREASYYTEQRGRSLDPNAIVRRIDGPRFFGFAQTQIDKKIASGDIPEPVVLSEGGRAKGWLGSQILEHHAKLLARTTKAD